MLSDFFVLPFQNRLKADFSSYKKVSFFDFRKGGEQMPNIKDLTGQTFGRLTAITATKKRDRKGSVYWRCQCACGNEAEVTEDCLNNGGTVSCGCWRREVMKNAHQMLTFVDGTCIDYLKYRKSRSDNKSGFRGVFQIGGKYRVNIGFRNKRYYLGTYADYNEAVRVRLEAEKELHEKYVALYEWWDARARQNPIWARDHPFTFLVEENGGVLNTTSPLLKLAEKEIQTT